MLEEEINNEKRRIRKAKLKKLLGKDDGKE